MAFSNPVVGGLVLLRTAMQSDDFVPGVSGWRIERDGSAEFNDGVFRGSLESGSDPGQHVIFNNPATGDAVDVYDSGNNLVFKIAADGTMTSIDPTFNDHMDVIASVISYHNLTNPPNGFATISGISESTDSGIDVNSGTSSATARASSLGVYDSALSLTGQSDIIVRHRANASRAATNGLIVSTDSISALNNLIHPFAASGTTNATGFVTLNHGASFTPTMILCQVHGTGTAPSFGTVEVMDGTITSTQFQLYCSQFNGTPRNTGAVTVWGVAIG